MGIIIRRGLLGGSSFKRLSFLINTDTKLSDRLSVQLKSNTGYSNRGGQLYGNGQGGSAGLTFRILASRPVNASSAAVIADPEDVTFINPVKFIDLTEKTNKSLTSVINLSFSYKLTDALTLKVLGGGYITNSKNTSFSSKEITYAANDNGLASLGSAVTFNWLNENTLNYSKEFGDHAITGLLGFTQQQNTRESYSLRATNFPVEINGANAIQDALNVNDYSSDKTRWALRSFLGRINYGYKDRYQLTATLRADGSSKFYGKNKYSYFPAAAFAWQVGEEKVLKDLNLFDAFKLRLSYGLIGNQSIPPYSALSQALTVNYFSGSTRYIGTSTASVANKGLTWETSETSNVGLDISVLQSRVNLTVDAYIKNTKDLLLESPVAGSTGFNSIFQNVGSIRNKGIELVLSTVNIRKSNFTWSTNINFNINRNKVIALGTQQQILTGSIVNSGFPPNVIQIGSPLGSLYGYVYEGVYQMSDFESNGTTLKPKVAPFGVPMPGNFKFKDISGPMGSPDGVVNAFDRTIIGNANPKNFGGIGNDFSYKRLSLSTFFSWQVGNDILNWSNSLLQGSNFNNLRADYYRNMWTLNNQDTNVPNYSDITGRQVPSTYYIKDGSFLRLQNVTFRYSLPSSLLKKAGVSNMDMTLSADNLALLTNYDGYDPELTSNDSRNNGVDYFTYPRPKTYTIGLNIKF